MKHLGELGSTKRVDAIAKVLEFIRQSQQYAINYPYLKEEMISSLTVKLLTKILPIEYLEIVYLAIDNVTATPRDKIETGKEILGKLKTCAILAVNQLVGKESSYERGNHHAMSVRNPLKSGDDVLCSVDANHNCHKSAKCNPAWGLLGCVELYKLTTVEERIEYCKESNCCTVCGGGEDVEANGRHKRCYYSKEKLLVKCTAWRSKDSSGKKIYCFSSFFLLSPTLHIIGVWR